MNQFENKKCTACEGDITPYTKAEVESFLPSIPGWEVNKEHTIITRKFTFKGFLSTMNFVNAIAYIAQQEMHHPDLAVGYNYCTINFSTHAINGLSANDFICATKINKLLENQ